jgi:myo-inositol 2-dehydrogenase / D-chiro-inositol 1-dehydrogenase
VTGRVRTALLGAGRIGLMHAGIIADSVSEIELACVADPDPRAREMARPWAKKTSGSWESVIADRSIQAVMICSATPAHEPQVLAAIEAGKQIFCEKPLAGTLAGALRCANAAARAGVILQVGFNRRYDPSFAALAQAIKQGTLGTPLSIRIISRDPEPPPHSYPRGPGGIYFDSSCHDFDMARYLMREEVTAVASFGSALFDARARVEGDLDIVTVALQFSSGAVGSVETCRTSAAGYDQRAEVHGTKGAMRVENPSTLAIESWNAAGRQRPVNPWFFTERYAEAYRDQLRSFARALSGAPPEVTADDGWAAIALAEAAAQAQAEERVVEVAEVIRAAQACLKETRSNEE